MGDKVNHPDHYQMGNGMETIDLIESVTEKLSGIEAFDTGNALKYLCRWKEKNGIEDLKKAVWYIQHLIDHENQSIKKQVDALTQNLTGGIQ